MGTLSSMQSTQDELLKELGQQGIHDVRVLDAMKKVPRQAFIPTELQALAYENRPLPIGHEQTISQPWIVAYMTQLAGVAKHSKALEIGTGSGYQTAVLATLADRVFTIERLEALQARAKACLKNLGFSNITYRLGDGSHGWPEQAPFDAILVTAVPDKVPPALLKQLAPNGVLVSPERIGEKQKLVRYIRGDGEIRRQELIPVSFVPFISDA